MKRYPVFDPLPLRVRVTPDGPDLLADIISRIGALTQGDPRTGFRQDDGGVLLRGVDERDLIRVVDLLIEGFGGRVAIGAPEPAWFQTVRSAGEASYSYRGRTSGSREAGVGVRVSPLNGWRGGELCRIEADRVALEPRFLQAAQAGFRSCFPAGPGPGMPLAAVKIELLSVSLDDPLTPPVALEVAARMALFAALRAAGGSMIEPVLAVDLWFPERFADRVIRDLASRRGTVEAQSMEAGKARVGALVPLGNLMGYRSSLLCLTDGAGRFATRVSHYAEAPFSRGDGPDPVAMAL